MAWIVLLWLFLVTLRGCGGEQLNNRFLCRILQVFASSHVKSKSCSRTSVIQIRSLTTPEAPYPRVIPHQKRTILQIAATAGHSLHLGKISGGRQSHEQVLHLRQSHQQPGEADRHICKTPHIPNSPAQHTVSLNMRSKDGGRAGSRGR